MERGSIGVVIAAYNAGATIDQTLASVAAQVKQPDEIIVVDDASKDDTAARAARWKSLLPIRVLTLDRNSGSGLARAHGIGALRADIVAVLDADDCWLPDHLAVMTKTHAEHGGLVAPSYLRWRPGVALREHRTQFPPPERQLKEFLFRNYIVSSALFERSLHDAVGGFRAYRRAQDWDLWIRMLAAGARVTLAKPPTLLYRLRPTRWPLDQILTTHIQILERFIDEHDGPIVAVAQRSITSHKTRWALYRSFSAAALGNTSEARQLARQAMRGDLSLKLRASVMMVAPRLGLRIKRSRGAETLQLDEFDLATADTTVPAARPR